MWLSPGWGSHTLTSGTPSTTIEDMSITQRPCICARHVSQDKQQVINTLSSGHLRFYHRLEGQNLIFGCKIRISDTHKRASSTGGGLQLKTKCFTAIKQYKLKTFLCRERHLSSKKHFDAQTGTFGHEHAVVRKTGDIFD